MAATDNLNPTPASSGGSSSGAPQQNPTFIEEQEGSGSQYDNNPMNPTNKGTDDGFSPRKSDPAIDPLDQPFGNTSAGVSETWRFKVPESVIHQRQPAPTHQPQQANPNPTRRVKSQEEPVYPYLNLDDKITSRPIPQRTRLVERRSWEQSTIATNVTRQVPEMNSGWVPVPSPTQLVQK